MNKDECIKELRSFYKAGDTVYTNLVNVSNSGMSRRIQVLVIWESTYNGELIIRNISHLVAKALGLRYNDKYSALVVGGVGMDMGYHVAYGLSRVLFKDTFECIGDGCPSNDHNNGSQDYSKHLHSDGGYALRHGWLS